MPNIRKNRALPKRELLKHAKVRLYQLSEQDINGALFTARRLFLANEHELMFVRASERALCHRFAMYLQVALPSWHVDCEYNRFGHLPKRFVRSFPARGVLPDIIVHRRIEALNALVIEAKCEDARKEEVDDDRNKLWGYHQEFGYQYGVILTFDCSRQQIDYEFLWGLKNEPNKAMEPTPVAVTDPANAGSAPSTSAAHLGR